MNTDIKRGGTSKILMCVKGKTVKELKRFCSFLENKNRNCVFSSLVAYFGIIIKCKLRLKTSILGFYKKSKISYSRCRNKL